MGTNTKGGTETRVHPESVRWREAHTTRKPDQNTVMGESAQKAYENFLSAMTDELSEEMRVVLKRAVDAPLKDAFKSNYRPEWLHAEGWSLTHREKDPQRKDNLGAAPKWANTEMMVLERIAKWFALNCPESYEIKIKSHFEMLMDSELIERIKFQVSVQEKDRFIKFLQDLNPFKKHQIFRKPSDLAQATLISHNVIKGVAPHSQQKVIDAAIAGVSSAPALSSAPAFSFFGSAPAAPAAAVLPKAAPAPAPVAAAKPVSAQKKVPEPARLNEEKQPKEKRKEKEEVKHKYPTFHRLQQSIVQIETDFKEYNYDEPWVSPSLHTAHGSGFVIQQGGKKYVLTNAHCVENTGYLTVRLANQKTKFDAKTICVSYQCDLALLEIEDEEFQDLTQPLQLGDMANSGMDVQSIGFPMGGNELSISKGIVSRIEVGYYAQSGLDMIQVGRIVQSILVIVVDQYSGDKVVGVAFQGIDRQGLGFMIPTPVVKHFLTEAFNGKPYCGFPILPMAYQTLENHTLRSFYGLDAGQTGVKVTRIDDLSDAFSKLRKEDILLEIEGLLISNEGTVDIPGVGNNIDMVHVTHMKFIGDTVTLKVLRKNVETLQREIHEITVTLDNVPLQAKKVAQTEFDKRPTYIIASGVSFTPLTYNYMEGRGAELEDCLVIESGCQLKDTPKKAPNEQIVIINEVLNCKETGGYDEYMNKIITKVNGSKISNIKDVVAAIENNKNPTHVIETSSGHHLVVKNMTAAEHVKLLKKYHIDHDRSEDLRDLTIAIEAKNDSPSKPLPPEPAIPVACKPATVIKTDVVMVDADEIKRADEEDTQAVEDDEIEVSEEEVQEPLRRKERRPLTLDDLPEEKNIWLN